MTYSSPLSIDLPPRSALWTWIFSHLKLPPSKTRSYIDAATGFSINYHTVRSLSIYISTALTRCHGLAVGDCVSIFGDNSVWWPVGMFSVLRVGGVVSGASPAYTVDEMVYALKSTNTMFLMTLPENLDVAIKAAEKTGLVPKERIFLLDGEMEGYQTLQQLVEQGRSFDREAANGSDQVPEFEIPEGKINHDVTAFLSFSSGTTGLPKAVCCRGFFKYSTCISWP
jgi:4-coumarate--CoA ligase